MAIITKCAPHHIGRLVPVVSWVHDIPQSSLHTTVRKSRNQALSSNLERHCAGGKREHSRCRGQSILPACSRAAGIGSPTRQPPYLPLQALPQLPPRPSRPTLQPTPPPLLPPPL